MRTTLILGIGNTLLSDEGVGIHVIDHLDASNPDRQHITCLDGGTLSFTLAGPIAEHDNLVVIDATQLHAPPGTLQTFIGSKMDSFLGGTRQNVHEVSLADLLDISRLSGCLPQNRALIGIQPEFIDWGDGVSAQVAGAIEPAAAQALALHQTWQQTPSSHDKT